MKKALCVGRDSKIWKEHLSSNGYSVTVLDDLQFTKANVLKEFDKIVSSANNGDMMVLTFSGKGVSYEMS